MGEVSRRMFLAGGATVAFGAVAGSPFRGLSAHASPSAPKKSTASTYGPLRPTRDHRDDVVRLDLPEGFEYRSFHPTGSSFVAGTAVVPARHDGMAAFPGTRANTTILVRNHEIPGPAPALAGPGPVYDPGTGGGTVSVEVDRHGKVLRDWVSLRGTQVNCAGGATPWGTWMSCEETVNGPDVGPDFSGAPNSSLQRKHGYMFEVPANGVSSADPVRSAGRFAKEAIASTPSGDAIFITEDNFGFPSGFYRYTPPVAAASVGEIRDGGTLQMLKVAGQSNADLSLGQAPGATYPVEWVTIDDPDPTFAPGTTNDQALVAVGNQGRAKGAAIFSRLEGVHYDRGLVYFVSTQGGAPVASDPSGFGAGRGQVWVYDVAAAQLRLVYESPSADVLDLPDNVVVSPRGSLVLCEDGSLDNFLRGLTPDGTLFDFARNADLSQFGQEFAGATFSPDGTTLFVNIQSTSGYSIAIWGPWARGPF